MRALAFQMLENDKPVPGWKLVNKGATRQWTNETEASVKLADLGIDAFKKSIVSPAQAEKELKAVKKQLPEGLVVAVSSGSTLARVDDPRPAVVNVGKQLTAALSKIQ